MIEAKYHTQTNGPIRSRTITELGPSCPEEKSGSSRATAKLEVEEGEVEAVAENRYMYAEQESSW
jgi:hypothetical protein